MYQIFKKLQILVQVGIVAIIFTHCTTTEVHQKSLLIQNATIIDGTGSDGFSGSVRITNNIISAVGDLKVLKTDSLIIGTGMVLSPGFIDTHSHHDWDTARTVDAAISQGITTIIVGQDGGSRSDLGHYFDSLASYPLSVNLGSYVGHNTVRATVMGDDFKREATTDEIDAMKLLVVKGMQAGALGLATGLEYDPGIYSTTEEVIELAKVAAIYGGRYISHMRSEDIHLDQSIDEILRIGREANIPVQISHFKLARRGLWGQAETILARLDSARATGINITADIYPYQYWQSTMTVLFPKRDFENRESAEFALTELTSPEGMIISRFKANTDYEGLTLAEIAILRYEDPVTTYMELLRMSQDIPGESIIAKSMDLDDIKTLISWPYANICSDGAPVGHPRGWGAFPRYLNMDTGESMATKIHKMTVRGAENIGLDSIGYIREGYYADLILFNADEFVDKATFKEGQLRATGLELVFVSGEIVYKNSLPTFKYSGRVIKK
jgi:N-acyl-D-amino-acid deacylase